MKEQVKYSRYVHVIEDGKGMVDFIPSNKRTNEKAILTIEATNDAFIPDYSDLEEKLRDIDHDRSNAIADIKATEDATVEEINDLIDDAHYEYDNLYNEVINSINSRTRDTQIQVTKELIKEKSLDGLRKLERLLDINGNNVLKRQINK